MRSERVDFPGPSGAQLAARLDLPEGPVRAAALIAHCFTCSKDIPAIRRIAGRLAAHGIAVMRFDFTGLGHSGGEFASTNFSSNVADLVAAAGFLADRGLDAQLLIGHSLGGAAVIKAAAELASVRAVVTIGAPADPSHVAHNFGGQLAEIHRQGSAAVTLGGRTFEIRRQFLEDIAQSSLEEALGRLGRALLVLHSPHDTVVDIDNAAKLYLAARHPKSFVTLDGADHMLSREADAEYAAEIIATWSERYLAPVAEPASPGVAEGVVRAAESGADGFRQDLLIGSRHRLIADEPQALGGTDLGPSPYQLLCAALAACTTMTIRLYARRKGIALAHVAADVTHDRRHAADCQDCVETDAASGTRIDVFRREIRLEGDLTEDERARLMAIADRCPVHRTLSAQAVIVTVPAA